MARLISTLLVLLALLPATSQAVLTIKVNQGIEAGIPIAIVPFALEGPADAALQPTIIISSDLERSGRFDLLEEADFLARPSDFDAVKFKNWRLLKTEALVVGKIRDLGAQNYEVEFRLIDVFRESQLLGQRFQVKAHQLRQVSHQISNLIYQQLTDKPGVFNTRIAYVSVEGRHPAQRFRLQVADADGFNPQTILMSSEPIMSPAWSPDGSKLAYVSFEHKRSMIFVHDLSSQQRTQISGSPGINSAPAWSPDGSKLAMTLSKDGNAEIYTYSLANRQFNRLTRHTAIDTEPAWSPDGRRIVFTSGRSGKPQIYSMSASGGSAQRLTFSGQYNGGPSYSPDGKSIVLITNQGNGFRVGLYSIAQQTVRELTRSSLDESPSFAPNGEMIIYATQVGGSNVLAAVSSDGRVKQTLNLQQGGIREPAWSPFNHNL